MTCHRAQGQTLRDCTVAVDLGLENPDAQLPTDMASMLYVAITRVRRLCDLFVSPIFPTVWRKMAENVDIDRRTEEEALRAASIELARKYGKVRVMKAELDWKPDYGDVEAEWQQLRDQDAQPMSSRQAFGDHPSVNDADLLTVSENGVQVPVCLQPVQSERHIGIDQGRRNFAIAVVDKFADSRPHLVAADLYDLDLPEGFTAADALLKLMDTTHLPVWMQQRDNGPSSSSQHCPTPDRVDRVVVHIEQMSTRNRHWKQFGPELGKLMQRAVRDPTRCVIQLSQPHLHGASGPMFKLGQQIVDELQLVPATYGKKRARPSLSAQHMPPTTGAGSSATAACTSGQPGDSPVSATTGTRGYGYRIMLLYHGYVVVLRCLFNGL